MKVRDVLEQALYLSVKDRQFNSLPVDQIEKDKILIAHLNYYLEAYQIAISKKGVYDTAKFTSVDLKINDLNGYQYIDLSNDPFKSIIDVTYILDGNATQLRMDQVSIADFDITAMNKFNFGTPLYYTLNIIDNKIYIYPKMATAGSFIVNGIKRASSEFAIDDDLGNDISDAFYYYLVYLTAKTICNNYKRPFASVLETKLLQLMAQITSENNLNIPGRMAHAPRSRFRDLTNYKWK